MVVVVVVVLVAVAVVVVVGRGGVDVPDSDVINSIPSVAQVNKRVVHISATHRYN